MSTDTELATVDHDDETGLTVREVDPTEERNRAVADFLAAAYARASDPVVTPDESKSLSEDFPDEAFSRGAAGDNNLIYIEHAYLRRRLDTILGIGQAVFIRRREWTEKFTRVKDGKQRECVRIYADLVLVVRGCVKGEGVGAGEYDPTNAKVDYSDALESAESHAVRRCCKKFGIGLQAWMKGWVNEWKRRQDAGLDPKRAAKEPTKNSGNGESTSPSEWQTWVEQQAARIKQIKDIEKIGTAKAAIEEVIAAGNLTKSESDFLLAALAAQLKTLSGIKDMEQHFVGDEPEKPADQASKMPPEPTTDQLLGDLEQRLSAAWKAAEDEKRSKPLNLIGDVRRAWERAHKANAALKAQSQKICDSFVEQITAGTT